MRSAPLLAAMAFLFSCTPSQPPADLVFVGANIITVDEAHADARAVAVRGDTIVAVGNERDVLALVGDETRVVELGDRALVPGLIDTHGHLAIVARLLDWVNLSSPPVGPVETIDDLVGLLQDRIRSTNPAPGTWVLGYGYDDSLLAENRHPTRDDLDRVSAEHPIVVGHVSGHLAAANSLALAQAGLDADSPDPPGGVIRRRPGTREPNGVLEETAAFHITLPRFQAIAPDELEKLVRRALQVHAQYGITTVQDGATSPADIEFFRAVAGRSELPIDVVAYALANTLDDETLDAVQVDAEYSGGFRVGGIKFMLDGSPQGRTAWVTQPYTRGPPGSADDYRAYPNYSPEAWFERIARLIAARKPVLAHANGDAAIDMMIDGVANAVAGEDMPDHRTVIIHAQLTRRDQLPRIRDLGLIPSYYAVHPFFWGDWHRVIFGDERASFISPLAATAEAGIPFTIHNDSPVVPPDMMRLMWIAVNRKTRSGYALGPDQRATPLQALRAITLSAAYQYFEEDVKGSITPGKRADLVILDANPLKVDPDAIKDIDVVETFARGQSVFRRE